MKLDLKAQNRLTREFMRGKLSSHLWMSAVAFGILMVLGFVAGLVFKDLTNTFLGFFMENINTNGVLDEDGTIHLLPLLYNNLRAAVFTIAYGFMPFIYLPALSLGINSLLLGFFAAYYYSNGMSMLYYFAAIIPHGIFELPALVLSIALGLYLCYTVNEYIRHNTKGLVKEALIDIARVYVLRAAPLFIVASLAESYVTPWIVSLIS